MLVDVTNEEQRNVKHGEPSRGTAGRRGEVVSSDCPPECVLEVYWERSMQTGGGMGEAGVSWRKATTIQAPECNMECGTGGSGAQTKETQALRKAPA